MISFYFIIKRLLKDFFKLIDDDEFRALFILTLLTLLSGSIFYSWSESISLFDAFYLSFITLTTIGYGDIYPVSTVGKIFTILYVIVGLGIISLFISKLASAEKARKISKKKKDQ
ncbi:potassium channel family protein [Enterococcus termitis]|jgi:voltage-gated potassium channel|uniref:Potassium channel domain-containing protein n=1 Tax=Enterococcus termitis TaxID=332950 RepID=A0A1E5GJW6_9ENTE|nr:potassium channel family protein [Enterococcus termitis]OEG12982.1 hypothetical protein BCR25_05705 [Enterococcus termitis]OJG99169.1 hypothetical protein RV18_GL002323 [Enterococcus termitis]